MTLTETEPKSPRKVKMGLYCGYFAGNPTRTNGKFFEDSMQFNSSDLTQRKMGIDGVVSNIRVYTIDKGRDLMSRKVLPGVQNHAGQPIRVTVGATGVKEALIIDPTGILAVPSGHTPA